MFRFSQDYLRSFSNHYQGKNFGYAKDDGSETHEGRHIFGIDLNFGYLAF